jgi:surface protein
MQMMFHEAAAFDRDLGWCVDETVMLNGAFAGTKCADGVEAAEDEYYYNLYIYNYDYKRDAFTNEAEAVALAAACGVTVVDIATPPSCASYDLETAVAAWLDGDCVAMATYGRIAWWDVSCVTDMFMMFYEATAFNADLGDWDVSEVTNMYFMFGYATSFNGDLGAWDVSKVTHMGGMFSGATAFNGPLDWCVLDTVDVDTDMFSGSACGSAAGCGVEFTTDGCCGPTNTRDALYAARDAWLGGDTTTYGDIATWDVACVADMGGLFYDSGAFNGDLSDWDVSKVTNMHAMFIYATAFNADLGDWDVSKVTTMEAMFAEATAFNADLGDWDVSKVTTMYEMFAEATAFNADLGDWDVSKVTDMYEMFAEATAFNADLGDWDVSKVTDMESMFEGAREFNADLGDWDVSKVTTMEAMFEATTVFNGDLSDWDVSKVTNMNFMFWEATAFNADLGWCIDPDVVKTDFMFLFTLCGATSCGLVQDGDCGTVCFVPTIEWALEGSQIGGEEAHSNWGRSVALSEDASMVAIGAPQEAATGAVKVFDFDVSTSGWVQRGQMLLGVETGEQFGKAVSLTLDGSTATVAVGAPYGASLKGYVRVLESTGGAWTPLGGDLADFPEFAEAGSAVDVVSFGSTTVVAVGVPATANGTVLAFSYADAAWTRFGSDVVGDAAGDAAGTSLSLVVDVDGDYALAVGEPSRAAGAGRVRVFAFDTETEDWAPHGPPIDGAAAGENFGDSVRLSAGGNVVVAGAPFHDSNKGAARAYYFLDVDGGTWNQLGDAIVGAAENDYLGAAVALNRHRPAAAPAGTVVAVGAPQTFTEGTGYARVLKLDCDGSWAQLGAIIDGDAAGAAAGTAVALDTAGETAALGAMYGDGDVDDAGNVRVFKGD